MTRSTWSTGVENPTPINVVGGTNKNSNFGDPTTTEDYTLSPALLFSIGKNDELSGACPLDTSNAHDKESTKSTKLVVVERGTNTKKGAHT